MKVFQLTLVMVAMLGAQQALAADGRPSDETLAAMGLAGLNVMSDSDGLAVRGFGYHGASAFGQSFAAVATNGGAAGSTNGYKARGKKKAGGENFSIAGVEVETGGGHGNQSYGNQGSSNQGYGGGSYGGGGHGGGCNDGCGGGKPPRSIKVTAFAGGSSFGSRK